jgi:hypothetical protein
LQLAAAFARIAATAPECKAVNTRRQERRLPFDLVPQGVAQALERVEVLDLAVARGVKSF